MLFLTKYKNLFHFDFLLFSSFFVDDSLGIKIRSKFIDFATCTINANFTADSAALAKSSTEITFNCASFIN